MRLAKKATAKGKKGLSNLKAAIMGEMPGGKHMMPGMPMKGKGMNKPMMNKKAHAGRKRGK